MTSTVKNETDYYFKSIAYKYLTSKGLEVKTTIRNLEFLTEYDSTTVALIFGEAEKDLKEHGFTDSETDEIIKKAMVQGTYAFSDAVCYKFLAYLYLLCNNNDYNTVEDLIEIIKGSSYSNIDDFIDEDFEEILKAKSTVKY